MGRKVNRREEVSASTGEAERLMWQRKQTKQPKRMAVVLFGARECVMP
jgi:hypothetical protein